MKTHLNVLYITTQGSYVHKRGETICVDIEKKTQLRIPLHNLEAIVGFGRIMFSPFLLGACAEAGVSVSMLTERGRFLAAVIGYQPGNVLLRREQYRRTDDNEQCAAIAASIVIAKIVNCRHVIHRFIRDHGDGTGQLKNTVNQLKELALQCGKTDQTNRIRGIEGDAAKRYFHIFTQLMTLKKENERNIFTMNGRTRRPPLDRCNALMSFAYTLLMGDCRSACEASGLDSQVGFLHRDKPGRPSLALDLMEEFRPVLSDRLTLSLINRRQLTENDFEIRESGAVSLTDKGRKTVLVAWQKRKDEVIHHPFLDEKMSIGLLPHIQARLLARHLRGDLDAYPAFIWE